MTPVGEWRSAPAALLLFLLLLAGCAADSPAEAGPGERLTVASTMSVFSDFAEAVGGDRVRVETLVPVGGDPHTYEPRPSDAARIAEADVVLDNGLGLSPWFEPLSSNVQGDLVVLTDGIVEEVHEAGGIIDPHLWMVPPLVADGYVTAIEDAFAAADPDGAEAYRVNAERYRADLADLDAELAQRIADLPEHRRKLVTSHDAYRYFAEHYGLTVVGTVIGVTTEEEPSAQAVSRLVDQVRKEQVPAIFVETTVNPGLIEQVARDTGVEVGDPLYGDSVGEPGSGAEDYVGMMRANVDAIMSALGGSPR
jgi:ABC-type Zn uptake system ZnuABC Zn-binding protein ZnuA